MDKALQKYHIVKFFEKDPADVVKKVARTCGVKPRKTYEGKDAIIYLFDCEHVKVEVIIAERGATMYVYAPIIDTADYAGIVVGGAFGVLLAGLIAHYGNVAGGVIVGTAALVGVWYALKTSFMKKSKYVELVEKLKKIE